MRRARVNTSKVLMAAAAGVALQACCATTPAAIHMGSPYDRYDHNRTRMITAAGLNDGAPTNLTDQVYAPVGSPFPAADYVPSESALDSLAVAHLVPIFSGISLPLSTEPVAGGHSDRDDLIDYLAAGSNAQDGVKPTALSGDTKATAANYGALLDVLQSDAMLQQSSSELEKWADARGITTTRAIVDARFRARAFDDILGLYCDNFWMVLYRLPGAPRFTRLVVVPVRTSGQDFAGKTPAGRDGRCGGK